MKKDKTFYFNEGVKWAMDSVKEATPLAQIDNISWQSKAFKEGVAFVNQKPQTTKENKAIVHHLKSLMAECNNEHFSSKRYMRIHRKMKTLTSKHGLSIQEISYMVN